MSHQPERKEKDCLNCGAIVHGRYCHACGQENIVIKQSFFSLAKHFVSDIFHFDGKFFDTVKYLLFFPGHVAKEYVKGRRASYLDPIRMYLFTSAVFFIIFFSVSRSSSDKEKGLVFLTNEERVEIANKYGEKLQKDTTNLELKQKIGLLLDTSRPVRLEDVLINNGFIIKNRYYKTITQYDSIQKQLPPREKDGWFFRMVTKQGIRINDKYKGNTQQAFTDIWDVFLHRFPYLLFVSLPFFAGILKLLYVRRKNFFYSDHAVFTLYHYIFSFILLLFVFGFIKLEQWSDWSIFNWIVLLLVLAWFYYLYKSMRHFYEQRRSKTLIKFFLLNLLGSLVIFTLFILFLLITAYQI